MTDHVVSDRVRRPRGISAGQSPHAESGDQLFAVRQRVGQGKEDAREQPSTVAARQPCLVQTMSELGDLVVPGLALVEV